MISYNFAHSRDSQVRFKNGKNFTGSIKAGTMPQNNELTN
jgi:hypothetical protein